LFFVVAEGGGRIAGLLPLARIPETGGFALFPGETWHGHTWLEQNRILATDADILCDMLDAVPGDAHLRYLRPDSIPPEYERAVVDEINYRFHPAQSGFSYDAYLAAFGGKARKKINRELDALRASGVEWRLDHAPDLERLFAMNLEAFGGESYFSDPRFLDGFHNLAALLADRGALRITTALVGGREAAIDMGALWDGCYTLLAGGTRREFPGVAKLINLHHIERACRERIETVDFLCGDFGWKERFHLSPHPLLQITLGAPTPEGMA